MNTTAISLSSFSKHLRILGAALVLSFACMMLPAPAHASTLTSSQISSILGLLQAFGASQTTINQVGTILSGGSISETTTISASVIPSSVQNNVGTSVIRWDVSNAPVGAAIEIGVSGAALDASGDATFPYRNIISLYPLDGTTRTVNLATPGQTSMPSHGTINFLPQYYAGYLPISGPVNFTVVDSNDNVIARTSAPLQILATSPTTGTLTPTQIQSILNLLTSFGANSGTIANMQTLLNGQTVTALAPASITQTQKQSILSLLQSFGASQSIINGVANTIPTTSTPTTGSLTIENTSSVPSQNIATNVPNQTLGGFQTVVTGVAVQTSSITVHFNTSSALEPLENVVLVNQNGAIVAGPYNAQCTNTLTGTISLGVGMGASCGTNFQFVTFSSETMFPVGTDTFTLEGLIEPQTGINGVTIQATTNPSNSDWGSITSVTGSPLSMFAPFFGMNRMTIQTSSLTVLIDPQFASFTTAPGAAGVSMERFDIDATYASEDVRITKIPLNLTEAVASSISNCQLFNGSIALNTGARILNPTSSGNYMVTFDNSLVIPKGQITQIKLNCNIGSNASGMYTWNIDVTQQSIFNTSGGATGVQSGQPVSTIFVGGGTHSVTVSSTLGSLNLSVDPSSPSYQIAAGFNTAVTFGVYRLHATNEAINLQKLGLVLGSGKPSDLNQVLIYAGNNIHTTGGVTFTPGTLLGAAFFVGNTLSATSTLNSIQIPSNSDATLIIKGNLSSIGANQPGTPGDLVQVNPASAQGVGALSGTTITATATGAGVAGIRIFKSYPTVAQLTDPTGVFSVGKQPILLRFSVTASPSGSIGIASMFAKMNASGVTFSSVAAYGFTDSSYSQPISNALSASGNLGVLNPSNGLTGSFSMALNNGTSLIEIPAGATYYFEFIGNVSSVSGNAFVSTTLYGDSSYLFGASGIAAGDNFTWSPNDNGTSQEPGNDWTDGYGVSGLPSTGITQSVVGSAIPTAPSAGKLSVSTDAASPNYQIVTGGTSGALLGIVRFSAVGEAININKIGLNLTNGQAWDTTRVYLYNSQTGALVGTAAFVAGAGLVATSTLNSPIQVPAGGSVSLAIKADIAGVGLGQPANPGDLVQVNVGSAQGNGASSGATINSTGSTNVAGVRIFKSYPIVAQLADTSSLTSSIGKQPALMRFSVTANSSGSISLGPEKFEVNATPGVTFSNVSLYGFTDPAYSQPITGTTGGLIFTCAAGCTSNSFTAKGWSPANTVVAAGTTYYFELLGDPSALPSSGPMSVTTTLLGDQTYLFGYVFGASGIAAGSNFLWSPNDNGISQVSGKDWTNAYGVYGLPSSGITQVIAGSSAPTPTPPVSPTPTPNTTFTITIEKYVNGVQATAANANNASFPMIATTAESNFNGGAVHNVNYTLGTSSSYRWVTAPFASGANYTASEVTGGAVVAASCTTNVPFALVGYSSGATLAAAQAATPTTVAPNFTGMTSNEYIIVWNESCPNSTVPTPVASWVGPQTFDGVSQSAILSPSPVTLANTFSIVAWVNPASLTQQSLGGGVGGTIIDASENGSSGFALGIRNTNNLWWWPRGNGDMFSSASIPLNAWTQVVVTYDGTTARMYINGALDSSKAVLPPTAPLLTKIGSRSWITGYFHGSLGGVHIYNAALSSSQVSQLYSTTPAPSSVTSMNTEPNINVLSLAAAVVAAPFNIVVDGLSQVFLTLGLY